MTKYVILLVASIITISIMTSDPPVHIKAYTKTPHADKINDFRVVFDPSGKPIPDAASISANMRTVYREFMKEIWSENNTKCIETTLLGDVGPSKACDKTVDVATKLEEYGCAQHGKTWACPDGSSDTAAATTSLIEKFKTNSNNEIIELNLNWASQLSPAEAKFEQKILPYYVSALLARQAAMCDLISDYEYEAAITNQGYYRMLLSNQYHVSVSDPAIKTYETKLAKMVATKYTCEIMHKIVGQPF